MVSSDGHPTLLHFIVFIAVLSFATLGFLTLSKEYEPSLEAQSSNLIGHWKFDEGIGNDVNDSSGGGSLGYLPNWAFWTNDGIQGGAILFDGVNDYVDFGDAPGSIFNTLTYPFSVTAWINLAGPSTSGSYSTILATDDEAIYTGFQLRVKEFGGKYYLVADLMNGEGATSLINRRSRISDDFTTIATSTWTHVAAVVGGPNDITLFIDCVDVSDGYEGIPSVASLTPLRHAYLGATSPNFSRSAPGRIGGRSGAIGGFFNGAIDDVRLYNKKLNPGEVCSNFWPSLPAPAPSVTLSANPTSITGVGQNSTITWNVRGPVTSCTPTSVPTNNPWNNLSVSPQSSYSDFDALWACLGQSPSGVCAPADIDGTGAIDINDVVVFVAHAQKYDINKDGVADLEDDLERMQDCFYEDVTVNTACAPANLTGNSYVNFSDLADFKLHLGRYNFNNSSNFSVEYIGTPPQNGTRNTGALAFTNHTLSLSCTGPGGSGQGTAGILAYTPPACSDGLDNDGDGKIDYSSAPGVGDPGCASAADTNEVNATCGNSRCERSLGETPINCRADCSIRSFLDF